MNSKTDLKKLSDLELGKLIGLLEGEGYFGTSSSGGKLPVICVNMTDKDVIEWLANLFGCNYYQRDSNKYNENSKSIWKICYSVKISGRKAAIIMQLILPYMSIRRKSRIIEILDNWKYNSNKRKFKPFQIETIRKRYQEKETILALAGDYRVSPGTIHHIVNYNSYKDVA